MSDYVPAIRGRMGDREYFVTAMKMGKVADTTKLAGAITRNASGDLNELIQREIGKRVESEMVPYLLDQPQHFYGALIVAVYGGKPEFREVKVSDGHELIDDTEASSYGFGLLRFDGSQIYYALDGQHRLRSMQIACERNPDLRNEEVAVIIVGHENTLDGMTRTRRLFSTLNRKAEKTKIGLNIAIDEDDAVAICTRRLVYEHQYLGGLGLVKADSNGLNSKQLPPTAKNAPYLTTLQALYECNEFFLSAYDNGREIDKTFKAIRPSDDELDAFYDFIAAIWTDICEMCPDLQPIIRQDKGQTPGILRDFNRVGGGSVIARPLGQFIIAEVISAALRQGQQQHEFIERFFREVSGNLDDVPWVKVIWNPQSHTIASGNKPRALTVRLLLHKFNLKTSIGPRQLLREYRELTLDKKMKLLRVANADEESTDGDDGQG